MESTAADPAREKSPDDVCHLYVDEAGTPDIFDAKGRINVSTEGCSRFFFLGMLEVDDPGKLNALWPQVSQIHDLHFGTVQGTFFTSRNPLTLEGRFGLPPPKNKKPQV